jgi:putative transposase
VNEPGVIPSRVQQSSTANRSKSVPFVVLKRATIQRKKIGGRRRHVLVDTQGHLLAIKVLAANRSDQQGARRLLEPLRGVFPRLKHLWGDSAYQGTLIPWLAEQLGCTLEIVRPPKAVTAAGMHPAQVLLLWDQLFPARMRPQSRRWVVERRFAWIVRWRRLCRDHEGLPESSETFIKLSACRRMLSLLAPPFP